VLGRFARTLLVVLMVAAMAGSAIAFALGVSFTPHSSSPCTVSYGSSCPPPTKPARKFNLHHIKLNGLSKIRTRGGHVKLSIANRNKVRVTIKLVLLIENGSGKIRRVTKTFKLNAGKTFKLNVFVKPKSVRAVKLKLKVTDAYSDRATIARASGKFTTR